jgi:hypothetical protein
LVAYGWQYFLWTCSISVGWPTLVNIAIGNAPVKKQFDYGNSKAPTCFNREISVPVQAPAAKSFSFQ